MSALETPPSSSSGYSPIKKRLRLSADDEEEDSPVVVEVVHEKKEVVEESPFGFEHLEHPADIQLHAWGPTMEVAMEQLVLSMYSYLIDDLELHLVDEVYPYYFEASGSDMESLVFKLLDECLVAFQSEPFFIGKRVVVDSLDMDEFSVSFHADGESYDIDKHKQGTDVKAITYSNMQIIQSPDRCELYVIIDI